MSDLAFPAKVRGLTWTVNRKLMNSTFLQVARSGDETRLANWSDPMWEWQFIYDYLWDDPANLVTGLTVTDLRTLIGFVMARQNDYDDFLLDDPTDDQVGPGILSTAWESFTQVYIGYSILDGSGHWQKVTAITTGYTGGTTPTFSTSGGSVVDAGATWTDQGHYPAGFPNLQAQLQVVTDTTDPVQSATVGTAGTGFVVGDYLAVIGGGGTGGVIRVATIGGGGAISSFAVVNGGSGYATTSAAALIVLTGAGAGAPTANIVAGNAIYSPVQRNYGGQFHEDITDLNPANTIAVYDNGIIQTLGTNYSLNGPGLAIPGQSFLGLYLTWLTGAPTGPVTATFGFYFRVRFKNPTQDYENFAHLLYTIGGSENKNGQATLDIKSSRKPQV